MRAKLLTLAWWLPVFFAGAAAAQSIDYDPRRASELRECDEHRYRGRLAQAQGCYSRLLESPDALIAAESAWALGDLERANRRFREIVQAAPRAPEPRIRWARLFLQTHQYADAVAMFREALEIAPDDVHALLGLARVYAERFEGEARSLIEQALARDEGLIEAHLLSARMALEEGRPEDAARALDRAGRIAESQRLPPLEVHALRAALELTRNQDPDEWIERVLAYNPRYGAVYEHLAHFQIMRRRYDAATVLLQRAVEVQPDLWSAHAELGSNLLRLGRIEEARAHLARAYAGDPYSATTVNSLRLLDRIDEFDFTTTELAIGDHAVAVQLRLHRSEAEVLRPYVLELIRRGIGTFSRRYAFRLREPLTIELYPDHDDFAVRVAALPGIGLLGVTFGYVVAMDSPSGRPAGEFHWGSTLWHELAHVFTLEATGHRVPRWLSEGISVFEEWRTGPTPGLTVPPQTIAALRDGQLLPVEELDAGFIRPSYPGQVQVSYVQSGLICLFIEERWGFERLAALLHRFERDTTTGAAIEAALEMTPAEFDRQFDAFARSRFSALLAAMPEWERVHRAAHEAIKSEEWQAAIGPAQRAAQLYPEHAGPDSPHLLLARAYEKLGRRTEAIAAARAYRAAGGWHPAALAELARWLDETGDAQAATELLQALNFADPLDPERHSQLGERLLAARPREALTEFQAALALRRHDPAPALYGAARALRALGDRDAGRRHLLDALAAAPHYRPAQALLLKIVEERNANE